MLRSLSTAVKSQEVKVVIPSLTREQIYHPKIKLAVQKLPTEPDSTLIGDYHLASGRDPPYVLSKYLKQVAQPVYQYRQVTHKALQSMQDKSLVISGPRNSGKSVLIRQVLQFCEQSDRLVFSVLNWRKQMDGFYAYKLQDGLWEQPDFQQILVADFIEANKSKLVGMTIGEDWRIGQKQYDKETPLLDVQDISLDLLIAWLKKQQVIAVVDGFNAYSELTRYKDREGKFIRASQFKSQKLVKELVESVQSVQATTTFVLNHMQEPKIQSDNHIRVEPFDDFEVEKQLKFFQKNGLLHSTVDPEMIKRVKYMIRDSSEVQEYCSQRPMFE